MTSFNDAFFQSSRKIFLCFEQKLEKDNKKPQKL